MDSTHVKLLVEVIARFLVDHPEQVRVTEVAGHQISVIGLTAAQEDLGKIIGKEGRNVNAIRILLDAAAMKFQKRAVLEILSQA